MVSTTESVSSGSGCTAEGSARASPGRRTAAARKGSQGSGKVSVRSPVCRAHSANQRACTSAGTLRASGPSRTSSAMPDVDKSIPTIRTSVLANASGDTPTPMSEISSASCLGWCFTALNF